MAIDDGRVRDLFDPGVTEALVAWIDSFPDSKCFAVWEDLGLSGGEFRVRGGALYLSPKVWPSVSAHLESIGVNPADRRIGPDRMN